MAAATTTADAPRSLPIPFAEVAPEAQNRWLCWRLFADANGAARSECRSGFAFPGLSLPPQVAHPAANASG